MKSVSIYTLTRNQNISCVQKLERQMSGRGYFLKMREWELDSMKAFVRELETHMDEVYAHFVSFIRFRFRDWERSLTFCRSGRTRS